MCRVFAAVLAAMLLAATQVFAADVPMRDDVVLWGDINEKPVTNAADYNPEVAEIRIGGVLFLVLRTPAAGYTVAERETVILRRLVAIYDSGKILPVKVLPVRGRPTIYVGNIRLVTVYPRDVEAAGDGSVRDLARHWAEGVRQGLLLTAPGKCFPEGPTYCAKLSGKPIARLLEPDSFQNVRQRGLAVEERLAAIVEGFDPAGLATADTAVGTAVTYNGTTLVTATAVDARESKYDSTAELAAAWVDRIKLVMLETASCEAPATP